MAELYLMIVLWIITAVTLAFVIYEYRKCRESNADLCNTVRQSLEGYSKMVDEYAEARQSLVEVANTAVNMKLAQAQGDYAPLMRANINKMKTRTTTISPEVPDDDVEIRMDDAEVAEAVEAFGGPGSNS